MSVATTIFFMVFATQQGFQIALSNTGTMFRLEIRGRRFDESILNTFKGSSLIMCAAFCHRSEGCSSFQYHEALSTETEAICELLKPDFDYKTPSVNSEFNVYSRVSDETTTSPETTVPTTPIETTIRQRMTAAPRNCPDIFDQIQCTFNQDIPKRNIECALQSTPDKKFTIYLDNDISWDDSSQFCSSKQQHLPYVKDVQFECLLTSMLFKMGNINSLENKAFTVGLRKDSNKYWKFENGTDVTDFPEFYVGPGPENTGIEDKLCGFVTIGEWKVHYRATPCDVSTQGIEGFLAVCTTA